MNFKKTIELLNNQGVTAYEIHKATGLNEAGVRRILNNEVDKPQRKTQESIVKFASTILSNTKETIEVIKQDTNPLQEKVDLLEEKIKDKEKIIQLLEANDDKLEHLIKLIEAMNTTVGLSALSIDDFRDQMQTNFETINNKVTAK